MTTLLLVTITCALKMLLFIFFILANLADDIFQRARDNYYSKSRNVFNVKFILDRDCSTYVNRLQKTYLELINDLPLLDFWVV